MPEYKMSDYGIFSDAVSTTNKLNESLGTSKTDIEDCKTKLNSDAVFMGPACEEAIKGLNSSCSKVELLTDNYSTIGTYLTDTATNYKAGDTAAKTNILSINSDGKLELSSSSAAVSKGNPKSSVSIPSDVDQAGYTVTCYGEGGWYLGGGDEATAISSGTNQESVHEKWLADGARYKNGIAVMNVDGEDHYLVATTTTFGSVGDNVTVNLDDGGSIPCVIADSKSSGDSNYTSYGHAVGSQVNVLEFEVDRNKYNSSGNPSTSTWGLDWNSDSNVSSIDNYGSVI